MTPRPLHAAVALLLFLSWSAGATVPSVYPPFLRTVDARAAAQDAGTVLLGARRAGAALAFIQTLQYYAQPDNGDMSSQKASPKLIQYGRRLLSLNPRHRHGVLTVAGVLGFNNGTRRSAEAMTLLREAAEADPAFWRYRALAGAIAYQDDARNDEAAGLLEAAAASPECPSMIKNILAGLHRKAGRIERAAEIYRELLNSRDRTYAARARDALEEIRRESVNGRRP